MLNLGRTARGLFVTLVKYVHFWTYLLNVELAVIGASTGLLVLFGTLA